MGCHQRKHRRSFKNTVVINEIEKEKQFTYLYPKGKIYCLTDLDFNVLMLNSKDGTQIKYHYGQMKKMLEKGAFFTRVHG